MRSDLHFLVVNDAVPMRHVMVHLLKELGYLKISEATDGAMALRTFRTAQVIGAPIGFVITDFAMPVMDGLELIRTIRSMPAMASLPVLMVTPQARREDILAAVEAGTDGYIVRPFNATALGLKLDAILTQRGVAA